MLKGCYGGSVVNLIRVEIVIERCERMARAPIRIVELVTCLVYLSLFHSQLPPPPPSSSSSSSLSQSQSQTRTLFSSETLETERERESICKCGIGSGRIQSHHLRWYWSLLSSISLPSLLAPGSLTLTSPSSFSLFFFKKKKKTFYHYSIYFSYISIE